MTQQNVLRVCRWLGYLSLCLFLCSWIPGCGGGNQATEKESEPDRKTAANEGRATADADAKRDDDSAEPDAAELETQVNATTSDTGPGQGDAAQKPDQGEELALASLEEPPLDPPTESGFSKFDMLMAALSIFVLSIFVGFEVITKVPPTLHTPLMSGSNAISGITLVGALLVAGRGDYAAWLGALAVVFATINVIGGFWVTHRMLSMFQQR